jgi:predicted component of type VI protein secretion system
MAPRFQITIRSGPNPGTVFVLEKSELILGRDLSVDLVINDAEVSRKHARLIAQQGGYLLEDLGSTNGTVVNGQRLVAPYLLLGGEVITIGEQISLVCERVEDDPDATRLSYRQPAPQSTAPQGARPQVQMPVQPVAERVYVGQVPASPVEAPVSAPISRRLPVWLIILLAAFFLFFACGGAVLVYIDANNIWCNVMPFLAGCN